MVFVTQNDINELVCTYNVVAEDKVDYNDVKNKYGE